MPDSGTIKEVFGLHAKASEMSWDQFRELIANQTHVRRLTTLAEMPNVAAFMASDEASAMTGTVVNLSMGSLDD
jgi:enoyl-[acyl-carrier-protein] reductase (NADH)